MTAPAPSLLAWAAAEEVEALRTAWARAMRRFRLAPRGLREDRLRALREAAQTLLRAELELQALFDPGGGSAGGSPKPGGSG